jgi:hypothetical protein
MVSRAVLIVAVSTLVAACDRGAISSGSRSTLTIDSSDSARRSDTLVADPPLYPPDVIELELLVTLGGDEPGALSNPPHDILLDSRGRYYLLASHYGVERPVVYSHDGRFLTALGGIGDGPGEFRMPGALIIGAGDTVIILDSPTRRMSVFSPSYEFIRSVPLSGRLESARRVAVLLGDVGIATNMDTRTGRDSSGPTLQIVSADGTIAHRFGDDSIPIRRWVDTGTRMRTLGWSRHGFWSGTLLFEYRLELWDSAGNRARLLRRKPSWFQPYDTTMSPSPEHPPHPALIGVMEDGEGRVWTVSRVADSQWVEGLSKAPVRGEGGTLYYRTEDPEASQDTYLEILDPVSGRLLVSRRFDGLYDYLINDSLIGRRVYDENGIPGVEIYRVTLSP